MGLSNQGRHEFGDNSTSMASESDILQKETTVETLNNLLREIEQVDSVDDDYECQCECYCTCDCEGEEECDHYCECVCTCGGQPTEIDQLFNADDEVSDEATSTDSSAFVLIFLALPCAIIAIPTITWLMTSLSQALVQLLTTP